MKPNQTLPILATLAPAALAAPPFLIALGIGAGIIWLLTREEIPALPATPKQPAPVAAAQPPTSVLLAPAPSSDRASRRITREVMAEALKYGERAMTRTKLWRLSKVLVSKKRLLTMRFLPADDSGSFLSARQTGSSSGKAKKGKRWLELRLTRPCS
jgi:hypothetical protein